jgi:hypothetical protein
MVEKSKPSQNSPFKADDDKKQVATDENARPPQNEQTLNASDRINLQHIMELRESFDNADLDKGGALELDEVSLDLAYCFTVYRGIW